MMKIARVVTQLLPCGNAGRLPEGPLQQLLGTGGDRNGSRIAVWLLRRKGRDGPIGVGGRQTGNDDHRAGGRQSDRTRQVVLHLNPAG
jgi:hypothetical protein